MPKTPIRGHAAKKVSLQVPLHDVHCRHLDHELQNVADKARLRGSLQLGFLVLRSRQDRDSLFRRCFRQDIIATEKLVVRAALASAANNLTPGRLRQLGSPGRRAVEALRVAATVSMNRDVRVKHVRSAIALLTGNRKKRSFGGSPVKTHSARLTQKGAAALASSDSVRRVQLNRFCMDSAASDSLPRLLAETGDNPDFLAASLSLFRAAAHSFILEALLGGKPTSSELTAQQIRKNMDSQLLRLFIMRWRRATAAGKITGSMYPWFDAVDWLVAAMHGAKPGNPSATRVPKSARVLSPVDTRLWRAQTASPSFPMQTIMATPASTPDAGKPVRHVRSMIAAQPRPTVAALKNSPFDAALCRERRRLGFQLRYRPPSPAPLAQGRAGGQATAPGTSPDGIRPIPLVMPAVDVASSSPISPGGHVLPGATLGDIAHHLARKASARSGNGEAASDLFAGTARNASSGNADHELSTDDSQ